MDKEKYKSDPHLDIQLQELPSALRMLGLNLLEQEIIDWTNKNARDGAIYFTEFCKVVTKKYREEDEELFRQNMFKVGKTS